MSHDQYFSLLRDFDAQYPTGRARASLAETQEIVVAGRTARVWYQPDADNPDEGTLLCNIDVLRLSTPPNADFCRTLLEANNLWAGTRGTTLGLRGDDVVMLSAARRVASLTPHTLAALLHALGRDAQAWQAHLTAMLRAEFTTRPQQHEALALRG
jgi:hypothetical protein